MLYIYADIKGNYIASRSANILGKEIGMTGANIRKLLNNKRIYKKEKTFSILKFQDSEILHPEPRNPKGNPKGLIKGAKNLVEIHGYYEE